MDPHTRYAPYEHGHAGAAPGHKDNMLRGWPYDQNDPILYSERQECQRILQRFHIQADTISQRDPLWRQNAVAIFEPARRRPSIVSLPPRRSSASNPATYTFPEVISPSLYPGYLGENVNIERGFDCDYGYNIRIANDVDIRANCYIEDAAVVDIGPGTSIGRDVMILTSEPEPFVPGRRPLFRSRGVVIGEGCVIGARVVILPGAVLPAGTRIRPNLTISEPVIIATTGPPPPLLPPGPDMRMPGR